LSVGDQIENSVVVIQIAAMKIVVV